MGFSFGAVTDAARDKGADVDKSATSAAVSTFSEGMAACLDKLRDSIAKQRERLLSDFAESTAEPLDYARRAILTLGEQLSDTHAEMQRKAMKAQSLKFQFKVGLHSPHTSHPRPRASRLPCAAAPSAGDRARLVQREAQEPGGADRAPLQAGVQQAARGAHDQRRGWLTARGPRAGEQAQRGGTPRHRRPSLFIRCHSQRMREALLLGVERPCSH